ncbi:GntP family permease [Winogradskyella sp.]|uniref:GntP family permease n=1 Tax=Winogradskyella sp. TaxID=1883156 RepID=UPI0026256316|nr:GntP family permease [Winogradskyella sp.]
MNSGVGLIVAIVLSIIVVVIASSRFKLNPFISLIFGCLVLGVLTVMPLETLLQSITSGFGNLLASIGLIVVFGCIIGTYLEKSGGANAIACRIAELVSQKKTLPAVTLLGATISIPVFCDSGFILLSGITQDLAKATQNKKSVLSLGLASGLYTTHTLIPPTPGPVAAAGNLNAMDALGVVIVLGLLVSIPVLLVSIVLSRKFGYKLETEDMILPEQGYMSNIPKLYKALLPLVLPILLIAIGSIFQLLGAVPEWLSFICNPTIALLVGAILAMLLLRPKTLDIKQESKDIQNKATRVKMNTEWFSLALKTAGPILIITGAGGAFGGVLKSTALSTEVASWLSSGTSSSLMLLIFVFGLAAVLKSAQGSSTSAMIITSSILAPLLPVLGWETPIELALAVLAIGGGAMTVSHLNDSYFWVVSQFSGIKTKDALRSYTFITGAQGLTVLATILILSLVLI